MRLKLLIPIIALVAILGVSQPASAQIPVTDLAHIAVSTWAEVSRYLQMAYDIVQEGVQIYNQIEQIKNQAQALRKLDYHNWRDIGPLYHQLSGILNQADSLTYEIEGLEEQFYSTFPGAARYTNFPSETFTVVQKSLDTLRLNLLSLHQINEDQKGSLQVLGDLQNQVDAAEGHEEVLEALAEIGSWQSSQLATIGVTLQNLANVQIVAASYQINQEARARQTSTDMLSTTLGRAQADQAQEAPSYSVVPSWMPPL
jgi:P-type conjugative transfer protein TrbJ